MWYISETLNRVSIIKRCRYVDKKNINAFLLFQSMREVGGFIIIFVIVLLAFAQLGHIAFGEMVRNAYENELSNVSMFVSVSII